MIRSIYHTARCGSTLLASLLSKTGYTFVEPNWSRDIWENGNPVPDSRNGSIIKFPSLSIFFHIPPGPKVFLYRPLAQHLLKYKSIETPWIKSRAFAIEQFVTDIDYNGTTQLFASAWVKQVKLALSMDSYFICSNDLFSNSENIAVEVINYFGLKGDPDMRFSEIDVKSLRINGQGDNVVYPSRTTVKPIPTKYGIIETSDAMADPLIATTVEWVEYNFPEVKNFTR